MSVQAAPVGVSIESSLPAQRSGWSRFLRQVRRRPIESAGGVIIVVVVITALTASLVAPFGYAAQDFG